MEVGDKLNPQRSYRKGFALKGLRQHIIKTNNPSTIGPGELLTVRFPDLKENQVIIPGNTKLTFNITLAGTDVNRTLVGNLGRNIRKLVVKLEGNEIISIDDCDILYSYHDCWKTATERRNAVFQGIVETDGQTENAIKHRINAGDKASNAKDQTVASIYDNRFCILLDFEILESSLPLYQYGLGSRLTYELTFADYSDVIKATDPDATYTISNISLEFDTIINASLASQIRTEYMKSCILYDRILRARIIPLDKSDTSFSIDINSPSKSLKGVLLIFTKERSATKFARDTEEFYNPKITKVEVTVEGVPNELYAQNMESRHQYDEIVKHFAEGRLKEAGAFQKDLQLHNVNIASYYTDKYALWLDFRTIDDNRLHGSGRRLENTSEGIRLQMTKKAESAGKLSCYLYIFQDAQINISDAQFLNVLPKFPHSAMFVGVTACGKTEFLLRLLETIYKSHFEFIVILCPTILEKKTYLSRKWIFDDKNVFVVCDIEGKLNEWIKLFKNALKGHQTLFIIDDCSAEGEINKKRDALSELAFGGRHRNHSLWVLTQKYNSVSKDVREQIKWLCLFFTKDRDSFEDCLRENDVIPDKSERDRLKKCLQDRPYSKLILKCYQPNGYHLL